MKPFDIELAKAGHPVYTRDGRAVRILCFDFISPENNPIIVLVKLNEKQEGAIFYGIDGKGQSCDLDLMMVSKKKKGWINVYPEYCVTNDIFKTEQEAKEDASSNCIATVKIEWEE